MTDLVKRLRGCIGDSLEDEAADEIELLQTEIELLRIEREQYKKIVANLTSSYQAVSDAALNPKDSKG